MSDQNQKPTNFAPPSTTAPSSSQTPSAKPAPEKKPEPAKPEPHGIRAALERVDADEMIDDSLPYDFEAQLRDSIRSIALEARNLSSVDHQNEKLVDNLSREHGLREDTIRDLTSLREKIAAFQKELNEIDASLRRQITDQQIAVSDLTSAINAFTGA